jgi:hypothetical protein
MSSSGVNRTGFDLCVRGSFRGDEGDHKARKAQGRKVLDRGVSSGPPNSERILSQNSRYSHRFFLDGTQFERQLTKICPPPPLFPRWDPIWSERTKNIPALTTLSPPGGKPLPPAVGQCSGTHHHLSSKIHLTPTSWTPRRYEPAPTRGVNAEDSHPFLPKISARGSEGGA